MLFHGLIGAIIGALAAISGKVLVHWLGRDERIYRRALDAAKEEFLMQFKMIELTRDSGMRHAIKPLRYFIISHLALLEGRMRKKGAEKRILHWLERADAIESAIYSHEIAAGDRQRKEADARRAQVNDATQ